MDRDEVIQGIIAMVGTLGEFDCEDIEYYDRVADKAVALLSGGKRGERVLELFQEIMSLLSPKGG